MLAENGAATAELRFENIFGAAVEAAFSLIVPPGWTAEPVAGNFSVAAGETTSVAIRVKAAPDGAGQPRHVAIAADLVVDGIRHGAIAEAVVDRHPDWNSVTLSRRGAPERVVTGMSSL